MIAREWARVVWVARDAIIEIGTRLADGEGRHVPIGGHHYDH